MVLVHTNRLELNKLKINIETKLKHTYLEKFMNKANIEMDKLFLFHHLYNQVNMPTIYKENMITTVLLIDVALHTHDSIPSCRSEGTMDETALQLSVLAGDYYSAQYYYLLSQFEDIEMTKVLAKIIKQISENKMQQFYGDFNTLEAVFSLIKETEALFYTTIATELNRFGYIPVVKEYLYIKQLAKEKEMIRYGHYSTIKNYLKKATTQIEYSTLFSMIDNEIEQSFDTIDTLLRDLSHEQMAFKNFIREKRSVYYDVTKSIAEEG